MRKWLLPGMVLVALMSVLPVLAVDVTIDIEPCKEPNIIQVRRPSLVPVAIYADDVDCSSLQLEGVAAVCAESKIVEDYFRAKFYSADIVNALIAQYGTLHDGDVFTLHLTGTAGGEPISGEDDVVIRIRGR